MTPSQAIRRMGLVAIRMDWLPDIVRLPLLKSECAWQYVGPIDPWEGEAVNDEGPKPADVIGHLQADDGHPDSDEAWEVALQAMDEWASVVWTEEIAQAKSAADPIWAEGDRVGARMAFKKRYDRLVRHARAQGKPAAWGLSPGFDPDQRASALRRAIDMGRLPQEAQAEVEHLEDQRSPEYALEAAKRLSVASDDQ